MPESSFERAVYKVFTDVQWDAARAAGVADGSPDDLRDGFIHLSAADQVAETLARHFTGRAGLVLVRFEAAALGPALRWEPSRNGALFPHLYGRLDIALAQAVWPLALDAAGAHILPQELQP